MASEHDRRIRFSVTKRTLGRTIFPHLEIKFNLFFHTEYVNYLVNQDSRTGPQPLHLPSSDRNTTAHVIIRGRLSYDAVQEAVGKAIGDRLRDDHERSRAIVFAWEEVLKAFSPTETLPKHVELNVDLEIRVRYWYAYVVENDYPEIPDMVPAVASSFQLLEKCAGVGAAEEESCCCICLEELGDGGVALRMPCSHVFHGGCIKEWLRKSHYCPLCRFQMPTATE